MNKEKQFIICPHCQSQYDKDDLDRICSNCFCCTGCEIYQCPNCNKEIVVIPIGKPTTCRYHNKDLDKS
nr:hypothetical protein [uncultured Carboxylicivirga sp.]